MKGSTIQGKPASQLGVFNPLAFARCLVGVVLVTVSSAGTRLILVSLEMIPAHTEVIRKQELVLNTHFRIGPCSSCPIAGYLIVSPRVHVSSLSELSYDAQNALGVTLAATTRAIESVVHPRRVYCALFAEETGSIHFHLFPRTDWLLSSYSRALPEDSVVSGPRLLDWARSTFREPVTDDYQQTTDGIFHALHNLM